MESRELMWLELMKFHGLTEIPGEVDNATIVDWFAQMGHPEVKDDETPWCSLTINIMAKKLGLQYSGKLDARSWLGVGNVVNEPKIGHVVIFWRESVSGWKGHVGLFAGWSEDRKVIYTLGGNQGNSIGIRAYPFKSASFGVLGFREL